MATKTYPLPGKVAKRIANATQEIKQIEAQAKERVQAAQRRQSEVIDTFAEMRGITLTPETKVDVRPDEEGETLLLVLLTPDDTDGKTGVSASTETATEQGEADAE